MSLQTDQSTDRQWKCLYTLPSIPHLGRRQILDRMGGANLFAANRSCRACCEDDRCMPGRFSSSPADRSRIFHRPRDGQDFDATWHLPPTVTNQIPFLTSYTENCLDLTV